MDNSRPFARHFAQLVRLLLREPGSTYEQQTVLDSLATAAKGGEFTLGMNEDGLRVNGILVPVELPGVVDTIRQLAQHGLAMVSVDSDASASDLFGIAGIIAAMPVMDDGGVAAEEKRQEIGVRTIRFAARPRTQADGTPRRDTTTLTSSGPLPDLELGEVFPDPVARARENFTPRSTQTLNMMVTPPYGTGTGHFAQFAAPLTPRESLDGLLKKFDAEEDPTEISRLLGDLAILAEDAAHDGRAEVAVRIMAGMARREPQIEDAESRRSVGLTLSRLGRREVLRVIASHMPRYPDSRDEFVGVLVRAGENGTDAVLELLKVEDLQKDRRVFFEALIPGSAGVPTLLHMLDDPRWFVVRTSAELLGEMRIQRAERPFTDLQKHADERVRRAAKAALMRLGTPRSMAAIEDVFKSGDAQFRVEAAQALLTRKDERVTPMLLHALDIEKDEEVKKALLGALGKAATREAVLRLIKCAEPERSLFLRKRSADQRVAATHALADAGTSEALDALRVLQADKDPDVRAAATLSLGRVVRRATTAVKPILG